MNKEDEEHEEHEEDDLCSCCGNALDDEEECNLDDKDDDDKDDEVSVSAKTVLVPPTIPTPVIQYAPPVTPRVINGTLYGIKLHWVWTVNGKAKSKLPPGNIQFMTTSVSNTYKRISSGYANFKVFTRTIKVNFPPQPANVPAAEKVAINAILEMNGCKKKGPNDYFLIVNGCKKVSNTSISAHVCHLINTLITTANHENGHSLGLLHSNSMEGKKQKSSKDGTSFMSIYSSSDLTASQNYYMGWLNEMAAIYDANNIGEQTFTIQKYQLPFQKGTIKAVVLPGPNGGYIFLSFPKFKENVNYITLHTTYGGKNLGSVRQKVFGTQVEYGGYVVTKVSGDKESIVVKVAKI